MTTLQLLVVQGRPSGKRLPFPPGDYFIGRGHECHIRPDSDWVSRQHCLLRVTPEGVFLRDLGSRNGTLVNGRLVSGECRLNQGDHIQVGPMAFEVRLDILETPQDSTTAGLVAETVQINPPPAPADTPNPELDREDEPTRSG